MNTHEKANKMLVDLTLGELSQQQESEVKAHLAECHQCRSELKRLEALVECTGRIRELLADEQACESAKQAILETVESEETKQPTSKPNIGLVFIWRTIMKSKITKFAAAAVIILVISLFSWFSSQQDSANGPDTLAGFSLLAKACAAEDAIFSGKDIVHIKNEIVVYPISKDKNFSHRSNSANFEEQVKKDFDELNKRLDFRWIPMCSLQANGQFRFNQLKLPLDIEPYTVIDQAWYDPTTGRFARVLKTSEKVVFANSYDGQFVYTSQVTPDGTLQLVKEAVTEKFRPPQKPAEFFGLAAGLQSSLREDTPMVQNVEQGTLQDGCSAHIYKVGTPDPHGKLKAYWLFKVRDDDGTIAEKEFVISGQSQLLIRRVLTESVQAPEISWSLAEIEGLNMVADAEPRVSVTPDMVIPNVTVQRMVERASFETYIFATKPSWTSKPEIIDCIDPASFGKRMFIFACRADDGRHLVLVQSPTYNKMLGKFVEDGHLVYTSPNGFKVWGGGPDKWYSQILLQSARAWIKDPPADDRIGYVLESPAGTFPALAVNGPITNEELHSLIDSLVPASETSTTVPQNKTDAEKEKLVDMALKISGKKVSADERGLVMRMFSLNEKDLIKGLGVFLELSGGQYPSSLDTKTVLKQSDDLAKNKDWTPNNKETKQKGRDLFFAAAFYEKLVRERKDVAYYGDRVTLEDSNKVLMRWKISDDKYRVIFADLSKKTVTTEELAELEKLSSK